MMDEQLLFPLVDETLATVQADDLEIPSFLFAITPEDGQTIIHCSYVSKHKYVNGGWMNICVATYLENSADPDEFTRIQLLNAYNVPLSPERHFFSRGGERKEFTLIFPPLPKEWRSFDLMEHSRENNFEVYNIPRNESGVYYLKIS
jgi:hypothetical protein